MTEEITPKGKEAFLRLKELAKERGLDLERYEDRVQMYDGLRSDVQDELRAVAEKRGWALGDVVASYVKVLIDHYRKIS